MRYGKFYVFFSVLVAVHAQPAASWTEYLREGDSLNSLGRMLEARGHYERALHEASLVPGHEELQAIILSKLAGVEIDLGRLENAAPLCQRAISILVEVSGEADLRVQTLRIELAGLYLQSGQNTTAEKLLRSIFKLQAGQHQIAGPEVAFALDVLACLHASKRKWRSAEAAERRALSLLEGVPAPHEAAIAIASLHLSIVLNWQKRPAEALPYAVHAKELLRGLSMPQPAMEASASASLASIYVGTRRWPDAQIESERAIQTVLSLYGPDHPKTAWILLAHAATLRRMGRKQEARVFQRRGERILRENDKDYLGETVPIEALLSR
jgi:tetratricopeptide (TPR) repeat protein